LMNVPICTALVPPGSAPSLTPSWFGGAAPPLIPLPRNDRMVFECRVGEGTPSVRSAAETSTPMEVALFVVVHVGPMNVLFAKYPPEPLSAAPAPSVQGVMLPPLPPTGPK